MRILIITAQYYPSLTPNVYRWGAIAEYWAKEGHEVHILCTRHSAVPDDQQRKGVWVHRAGQNSLLDWIYNLMGQQQRRTQVGSKGGNAGRLRRGMEWLVDHTWRNLYWPDGRCLWYRPGRRRALELVQAYNIEAVVSVGLPFTAHRIAQAAKHRFPNLRWLMDIEDPFSIATADSRINNTFLYAGLNRRAEQYALQQADAVSVTVAAARSAYAAAFPAIAGKLVVVPPVFSLPDKPKASFPFTPPDSWHLAYFGAFYHHIRTPDALLALLAATLDTHPEVMARLRVHFFGEIHPAFRPAFARYPELAPYLQQHGLVSRDTVAAAMQSVDGLINIGNRTTYHLPSKSVDYLMSGKPILNICYAEQDTFREFLSTYPLILHLQMEAEEVSPKQVAAFVHFVEDQLGREAPAAHCRELAEPYMLDRIAERFLDLLR